MNHIEQQLITAAKIGKDSKYFGHLVEMHQVTVRGYLRRLTRGDAALGDDLAQETFMLAFRKISDFKAKGSFKSWLFSIAYRTFLMHIRAQASKPQINISHEDEWEGDKIQSDEKSTLDIIKKIDMEKAIIQLKKYEISTLSLCYTYGMSHGQISQIMDMPIGTVKSHIKRGKDKLKNILTYEYGEMQC